MLKPLAFLRLLLIISSNLLLNVEAADVAENQLKAAYLIHLSEFTTWSDAKMQLPSFSICLSKKSSLSEPLEEIKGRLVKGKPLEIVYDFFPEKLNTCHILFVEEGTDKKIVQQIMQKNDSILSVSDESGLLKTGGVIEFYTDSDKKLKMRVNLKALRQANLIISSNLLRLMEIIP